MCRRLTSPQRLEFGSSSGELNSARPRVNVNEAYVTLALRARRNTQLLAQALSVIIQYSIHFFNAILWDAWTRHRRGPVRRVEDRRELVEVQAAGLVVVERREELRRAVVVDVVTSVQISEKIKMKL